MIDEIIAVWKVLKIIKQPRFRRYISNKKHTMTQGKDSDNNRGKGGKEKETNYTQEKAKKMKDDDRGKNI